MHQATGAQGRASGRPRLAMDRSASHLVTAAAMANHAAMLLDNEQRRNISSCRVMDHDISEDRCSQHNLSSVMYLIQQLLIQQVLVRRQNSRWRI